jgi:hypothetical protein
MPYILRAATVWFTGTILTVKIDDFVNSMDVSGPEEWTDPFIGLVGTSPTLQKFLIISAAKDRLLSVRAIDEVCRLVSEE